MVEGADIKIESDVPCDFSETGLHKVTMIFREEEDGLRLRYLSSECEQSEGTIGEYLSTEMKCCGMLVDDVRLAASGEEPRNRNPILARALREIKNTNYQLHKLRATLAQTVAKQTRLEVQATKMLPTKALFFEVVRNDNGAPRHARIVFGSRSNTVVLARYRGKGLWRMSEHFDPYVRNLAENEGKVLRIDSDWNRMENAHCYVCNKDIKPSSRKYHIESERHLNKLRDRIYETMEYVSERLYKEDS